MPQVYFSSLVGQTTPDAEIDIVWTDEYYRFLSTVWDCGRAVTPDEIDKFVPKSARLTSKGTRFPAFFNIKYYIVCGEIFRLKVEELEPGIHQFFPFQIYLKDGSPYNQLTYLMNICTALDSIIPAQSNLSYNDIIDCFLPNVENPCIAMDSNIIKGHHVWVEKRYLERSGGRVFSDELNDFVKKNKLRGLALSRAKIITVENVEHQNTIKGRTISLPANAALQGFSKTITERLKINNLCKFLKRISKSQ